MKTKNIFTLGIVIAVSVGAIWLASHHAAPNPAVSSGSRKVLYYQSAMHPWIKSDKPGKCPICGMNLVPIYEGESGMDTNLTSGTVTLNAGSVSAIHVQTELVERRQLQRILHVAGTIQKNSPTAAWFEFTVYERDLPWLKVNQIVHVTLSAAPENSYEAQIKSEGTKPFADRNLNEMTGSTKVRAKILHPPVVVGDSEDDLFNNLHAEGHLVAVASETLTIPRSAVISRGAGPMVYVQEGDGYYTPRVVVLGRVSDDLYEVLDGLSEGEKVVTTGNVLIDSEAQITAGR